MAISLTLCMVSDCAGRGGGRAGAVLPEHRHDNEPFGMVVQGSVIFRVGSEERSLSAGGIWRIPPDTPHSVTAGDAGAVVIDIFSPAREDWTAHERLTPRQPSWP